MTPVTFPLLKLPLLTIKHVFLVMTMEQIYDFSYCSKKAQRILKACNGKNVEIRVYFSGDCEVHFHRQNQLRETFSLCLKNIIPGCSKSRNFLRSTNDRSIQLKFSTSPLNAAISRIDHLFNSFDMEVSGLFIDGDCVQFYFQSLVRSIFQWQNVFTDVGIFGSIAKQDLKYFIENSTTRRSFYAVIEIKRPYNLNLNAKMIFFKKSEWLTVFNLLTTNFETGLITEPQWDSNDWITLLNAWKNGWNPKMSHLITKSDHFDFKDLTDNFPFGTIRGKTVVRNCQHHLLEPTTLLIKVFNCEDKNMIILRYSESVDSEFFGFNKKFLSCHTNYFDGSPDEEFFIQDVVNLKFVNECFQISHGVQLTAATRLLPVVEIASHYKLSNVVKYLERQTFQQHFSSNNILFWTRKAIQFDLNHLLSQLMRRDDSLKILKLVKTETPEMSGRIMKMIIAKYLYAKV